MKLSVKKGADRPGSAQRLLYLILITVVTLSSFLTGFLWAYYSSPPDQSGSNLVIGLENPENMGIGTVMSTDEGAGLHGEEVFSHQYMGATTDNRGERVFLTDLRLEREREMSRLEERLEGLLATADEEGAKTIHQRLLELTNRSSWEKEVESLLLARGYQEAVVMVHDHSITVVVKGLSLDAESAAAIGELVGEVTGYPLDQIRIVE